MEQVTLSETFKPVPFFDTESRLTCFTVDAKNINENETFEKTFSTKKLSLKLTIQKCVKKRIVEVASANRLKCTICSYFESMCMPCRHVISINKQNLMIEDNHVRWMKLYGCGRFDAVCSRKNEMPQWPKLLERYDQKENSQS